MVRTRKQKSKEELTWWKRLRISELGLRIVLAAVLLTGGFSYLVMTTTVATRGLEIKSLSDRLATLNAKRETLQAEADRLQSLQQLDVLSRRLDLVKVSRLEYVGATGPVASR